MSKRKGGVTSKTVTSNNKDIRSFFTQKEKPNKEPVKKRVLDDSSDEEIFATKKKKTDDIKKDACKTKKPEKTLQEVKPTDLFGSGPIKRTEPIVKKEKNNLKTEIGIHDDDDFEKSLLEIDNVGDIVVNNEKDHSPLKNGKSCEAVKSEYFNGNRRSPRKHHESIKEEKSPTKKHTPEKSKNKTKYSSNKPSQLDTDVENESSTKSGKSVDSKSDDQKSTKSKPSKLNVDAKPTKPEKSIDSKSDDRSKKSKVKSADDKKKDVKKETESKTTISEKSPAKLENYKIPKSVTNKEKKSDLPTPVDTASSSLSKMSKSKRIFSEFVDNDEVKEAKIENHDIKSKKKKLDTSLNNSVISDEERFEKKRHSAALYQNYLNRSGPKNLGAKEMPEGAPNCLKDCAFLLTGVLDSFEREEITETITKYGGTVKSGISKKVTYVLAGDEAGPAKIAKAQDLGIKIMNEDDFLKLIRDSNKSGKGNERTTKNNEKTTKNNEKNTKDIEKTTKEKEKSPKDVKIDSGKKKNKVSPEAMKGFEEKIKKSFYSKSKEVKVESPEKQKTVKSDVVDVEMKDETSIAAVKRENSTPAAAANSQMWVEKYKPQNIKQIIGQHGDASNVKKLINWLTKWYVSRKEKIPKPSPWAKNDDGAYYKAALLSGPPGVGKTTTVSLVCKELGFDVVEFNASDTRNKTLIKGQIGELLTTTSLSGFAKGDNGKKAVTIKHVLVMDEVDGMAGNEDRGGLQELISLIKTTAVPIICMCNDRNSEKMRSLVNYCYDLKFTRPRVDQIKSAMLSVCCKESIKIPVDALTQLIISSNQDVRQTLNALSMWAIDPSLTDGDRLKKDALDKKKDLKLGPWEAVRKVFSAEDHKTMSINDKSDLFFYDYSLSPLFVQENYLNVTPHCPKHEILERISQAADSISLGDIISARIRGSQAWNLLPMQAMYSSVIPGSTLSGHVSSQVQFPGWLGKNSRRSKMQRLAQEIHAHTRLSTTGSKSSIFLDYSRALRDAIVTPLVRDKTDGIQSAIEVLNAYHLLREDLDSLTELSMWPGLRDPMVLVESKVKAAMTRTYNKQAPALPHAAASFTKSKRNRDNDSGGNETEDDDIEDSEPENDGMIKVKKKSAPANKDAEKPSSSKGDKGKKGKGKK